MNIRGYVDKIINQIVFATKGSLKFTNIFDEKTILY